MDTHKETIFTGSEVVETGKQAEGRKKILLCKPFKDWAVVTANLIPNSSQHNLREKNNLTHTDMMILMDVMESELTVSILISNVAVLCSNQTTLHSNV